MHLELRNNHFELLPERAIYWQEQRALILADLHIGKGMHFRKEGIAIPNKVFDEDLQTLAKIIEQTGTKMLIVVGDMFHSHHNVEITLFDLWRVQYPDMEIHLIKGNHDILSVNRFKELNIITHDTLELGDFVFSHERCEPGDKFCFSGHLHPGIRINGIARQTVKLPCFHFTPQCCTLPAFSKFTGLYLVKPAVQDRVFALLEEKVFEVEAH
ncbi:MAG TPA: ligase-associated DNA damage response endonuclease PdeM [Chitinophagales bacterium]|nr:ligase-associated DNA damage response endonuclease PdeM [Chitinophagales bacterium]